MLMCRKKEASKTGKKIENERREKLWLGKSARLLLQRSPKFSLLLVRMSPSNHNIDYKETLRSPFGR